MIFVDVYENVQLMYMEPHWTALNQLVVWHFLSNVYETDTKCVKLLPIWFKKCPTSIELLTDSIQMLLIYKQRIKFCQHVANSFKMTFKKQTNDIQEAIFEAPSVLRLSMLLNRIFNTIELLSTYFQVRWTWGMAQVVTNIAKIVQRANKNETFEII